MSSPTPELLSPLLTHMQANTALLAESLNLCLDTKYTFKIAEPQPWNGETAPAEFDGPGLLVGFEIDGRGLLVVIPASLPLPTWYRHPDKSQKARLDTLPVEWSMNLLPEEIVCDVSRTVSTDNLRFVINFSEPIEGAQLVPWLLLTEGSDAPAGTIWLLGPINEVPIQVDDVADDPVSETPAAPPSAETSSAAEPVTSSPPPVSRPSSNRPAPAAAPGGQAASPRMQRILKISVPVMVTLAEKKIMLSQLLSLGPGAIVQFDKSCEDMLDLRVNNEVYCRGEAVKIGEKFGLKVTELGPGPDPALKHRGQVIQT